MVRIAVTGGIACGKSLLGGFLSDEGIPVCEADEIAHVQMKPGTRLFRDIVRVFGKGMIGTEGTIDRRRLGKRVFAKPSDLAKLNAMAHPAVVRAWARWLTKQQKVSRAAAVIVPLLYETGRGEDWDAVICVMASEAVQIQRLKGRGLSSAEAMKRIKSQMDTGRKAELADYVIVNNGTGKMLKEQAGRVVRHILEK